MRGGILARRSKSWFGPSPAAASARAQSRRMALNVAIVMKMSDEAESENPMQRAASASGIPAAESARQ